MPKVSIIIVSYHDRPYLQKCIHSLKTLTISHEIIVVDNAQAKLKLPANITYIQNPTNIGYGAAINIGAAKSGAKYLLVLNPDTLVFPDTVEKLVNFLETHQRVAIAAPLLLDEHDRVYPLQGTGRLNVLTGILTLSFLNKLLVNTSILQKFWLKDWDKKSPRAVDVAPGTAMLIRRQVFEQVSGFDPHIFIYFEEHDLCYRVSRLGWEIYIVPGSKLVHYWGKSSPGQVKNQKLMQESRFYYFKKHFGLGAALLVEVFARAAPGKMLKSIYAHRHSIDQKRRANH